LNRNAWPTFAGIHKEYFGRIFALSEEEKEFCIQVFQEEIIKYIKDRKMNG
jgi:hypothetical protein